MTPDAHDAGMHTVKEALRSVMRKTCPELLDRIVSLRRRRMFRQQFRKLDEEVKRKLFPDGAPVAVQSGPFRGMRYLDEVVWGSIASKWLGSNECELHGVMQQVIARGYERIIDVGCSEGYYVVGLALAIPAATVFAFDMDFISRNQVARLARLNNVKDRVVVGGYCGHADLDHLSGAGALVICDIEGCELELLDPAKASSLYRDDILVELHDAPAQPPIIEQTLCRRFAASHEIERFIPESRDRWVEENISAFGLSRELLRPASDEHRTSGQAWLWMRARQSVG